MSWRSSFIKLIGRFWTDLFAASDFITGLENVYTTISRCCSGETLISLASRYMGYISKHARYMPSAIYVDTTSAGRAGASMDDILNNGAILGADAATTGYIYIPINDVDAPDIITDHVSDWTTTLVRGFDYDFEGGALVMYADPSTCGFSVTGYRKSDGSIGTRYTMFGWKKRTAALNDYVSAMEDPLLAGEDTADTAWRIHQLGATVLYTEKLLAAVSDSVVCEEAGTIDGIWVEQGVRHMRIGDRIYSASSTVSIGPAAGGSRVLAQGDDVAIGDTLFGTFRYYRGENTPPAAAIPSIHVRADAGELIAANASTAAHVDPESSVKILPLTTSDTSVLLAYRARCVELASDPNCPKIEIPDTVNPYLFIMQKLRRGRSAAATLVVTDACKTKAAIECIRRGSCAAGILSVYVSAVGDTSNVSASFSADAGNAAVADVLTITISNMLASASRRA